MFATTKQFLDYFNLKSLQDLPPLSEIKELEKSEEDLDLSSELSQSRILEIPEEDDSAANENLTALEDETLAEEAAAELSKKPLDEILNMGMAEELEEDGILDDFSMADQSEGNGELSDNENEESLASDSADSEIIETEDTSFQ
jgi:segregation and condensation protein B